MTASSIAARLSAQSSGHGEWIAHCPAHDDRSPSLSVAEGRAGRVLLFCHAGCEIDTIARALGIELRDLFGDDASAPWHPAAGHRPTTAELRVALCHEAELYREDHDVEGELLTRELNAIRRAVSLRLRVLLYDLQRQLHEGSYGGRERDPAWSAIFKRALFAAGVELLGAPIAFDETLPPPRTVLLAAEDYAAAAMCTLERAARDSFGEVTA